MHEQHLPALRLCFSSADSVDAELDADASAWARAEPLWDELEGDCEELEIPADELAPALPTETWNLGTESRSPVRRAIAMAAAFVPLMFSADPVLAAEPPESNASAPPESNASAPPESNASAPIEGPAPAPVEHAAPTPTETTVPPPVVVTTPALTPDAIADALRDRRVVLRMADGSSFRGTVLSASDGALICARESDGLVVTVNAAEITTVYVEDLPEPAAKPKAQNGQGLIVFGSIATAIGGALAVATVAVASDCATDDYYGNTYICPYYTLPLGIVGAVNLAVGIPLLAVGVRKRAAAREAEEPVMSAFVTPGRNGGVMGGVGLRF